MQIIDELETRRRGPYGGGIGHVGFAGGMDMALALRTMVIPNPAPAAGTADGASGGAQRDGPQPRSNWIVHLQVRHESFNTAHAMLCQSCVVFSFPARCCCHLHCVKVETLSDLSPDNASNNLNLVWDVVFHRQAPAWWRTLCP